MNNPPSQRHFQFTLSTMTRDKILPERFNPSTKRLRFIYTYISEIHSFFTREKILAVTLFLTPLNYLLGVSLFFSDILKGQQLANSGYFVERRNSDFHI